MAQTANVLQNTSFRDRILDEKKDSWLKTDMKKLMIYVHGKGGNAREAEHYKQLFSNCDVVGFDYRSQTPWDAQKEFSEFFDAQAAKYASIFLVANSIGAFFSLCSLANKQIDKAFLISPVVDMEGLICNMMRWANVTEDELFAKKEIKTDFGEVMSWDYLCYVRQHPVKWNVPTHILYGERDNLTSFEVISKFASQTNASLTVMPGGEHWFHTEEQLKFLDDWIRNKMV